MEESNDEANVVPELYFLIAKFLSGGPLKETAKTLLKELERVEVLPRRLDWEGHDHSQSFHELEAQYADVSWRRLAGVCSRALQLARRAAADRLGARLSLLSESLVRARPQYASHREDHALVRRLAARERGAGPHVASAPRPFPARLLRGLALQRRTLGHLSAVYCVAVERSGRFVLTGADDLLVKVWRVDGRLAATLRGAGAEITDVSASADGALLAAGSVERLVRVWCLATSAPRAVLHAHQGTITSVAWAPLADEGGARRLASTSTDGSVAFWTCSADGQFLPRPVQYVERLRPGACHMICAAWSAGGAFLAAGSADQRVRVYALHGPTPRRVLETPAHSDAVDSLAWAHRGLRFVSGSKDGTAALWTLYATQWRHTVLRVAGDDDTKKLKVTMVCWDRSDEFVLTAVSDSSIRVWCARSCTQVRTLAGHHDEAYVLEAHPRLPGVLLSAGHDGQLFVWDVRDAEPLARFHNLIDGQGEGAIFDAKWAPDGTTVAASDSHGHLLLLGLGAGDPLLGQLPAELFFHTDYRPLARDALGGALDEQTELPPHLMPPPFLVDVEGAPHPPRFQRLVPGREALPPEQLVPRSRLDALIEALAADPLTPPDAPAAPDAPAPHGVWRGEGVRHTPGSWHGLDVPPSTRPVVPPAPRAEAERLRAAAAALRAWELALYRREMRRRPLMISTAPEAARRRPGRRPRAAPRPAPRPPPARLRPPDEEVAADDAPGDSGDTSDESVRLSASRSSRSSRSTRSSRSSRSSDSESDSSLSDVKSDSSASSQYSDWETGAALAPPARARRRPVPTARYSPSATSTKRVAGGASGPAPGPSASTSAAPGPAAAPAELPEAYRVGEWLTAVSPRKAPYHPQMGDHCLYFRLGHQRYFEAVAEKDLYKIHARDKPWELMQLYECEAVQVVGIKYVIKPPRVVCLRVLRARDARAFTVRYHDMPDVIDFLVLRHHYDAAVARRWGGGDRFRCMIDDSWWTGQVLERITPPQGSAPAPPATPDESWARDAASNFLCLRVRWDNGEVERLSPWDLEPLDPERLPAEPGGSVSVLPHELEAVLARGIEWPSHACRTIAHHISQVMSLSVAEPFVAPVDLQLYPSYAMVVPYPVDLATIRARFDNLFYRRAAAAQFDARYLASNAEQFNEPHSPIVRQARLVTDLLLHIISSWQQVDVVGKYHELAAAYHSSDDDAEPKRTAGGRVRRRSRARVNGVDASGTQSWEHACAALLRELCASPDAEPFRQPVSPAQAPDYLSVITRPMDLGTVRRKLEERQYSRAEHVAADVRLVFANSRLYNTNKRSRIYSMTVRLSSLFEALWARLPVAVAPRRTRRAGRVGHDGRARRGRGRRAPQQQDSDPDFTAAAAPARRASSGSSDTEPLAATSRRVHAARASRRADSWDSDVPLTSHRKGKGVGKKTRSRAADQPADAPSTSAGAVAALPASPASASDGSEALARLRAGSSDGSASRVEAEDEPYDPRAGPAPHRRRTSKTHRRRGGGGERVRKRRRARGSSSSGGGRVKRARERCSSGSWSSSSSCSARSGSPRRYESDRSYRPRDSTDDDRPLTQLRVASAAPGVSLRRRGSPRRYNEDSEDDSAAAISKRRDHAHHAHHALRRHASVTAADHDYFNGHARVGAVSAVGSMSAVGGVSGVGAVSAVGAASSSGSGGSAPVSISSRGRVRKLTAKARGLLRH